MRYAGRGSTVRSFVASSRLNGDCGRERVRVTAMRAAISTGLARVCGRVDRVTRSAATAGLRGRGTRPMQLTQEHLFRVSLVTIMATRCPAVLSGDTAIAIGLKRTPKHESSYFIARRMV